ncbi:MAG: Xaa-Pro dipeptidase [Myxococcota bacterium]
MSATPPAPPDNLPADLHDLYTDHLAALQDGYARALDATGYDAVVIHSGLAAAHSSFDDQYWPHKPTPAFAHWLPLTAADTSLLVEPGKRPVLLQVALDNFWDSEPEPESDHFWGSFDESEVAAPERVAERLPRGRVAFIGDARERAASWGLADTAINPPDLLAALDQLRAHKSDYERACMATANRRAAAGHAAVLAAFAEGEPAELDLHLLYLRITRQDDSQTPYKNIVAMDENAAILHHVNYRHRPPMHRNQSLLIDAGATCLGYASDITRTAVKGVNGGAAATFAELIRAVEEVQAEVCRRVEIGKEYETLHDETHHLLGAALGRIGVARASAEELVDSGATRCFLPHGLGHSLGVQVHDVGCRLRPPRSENPFLRNTTTIAAGQVFTIEPGCYFIDSQMAQLRERPVAAAIDWDLVDALAHFGGVRIEDNIAVREDGITNLTRDNWPPSP